MTVDTEIQYVLISLIVVSAVVSTVISHKIGLPTLILFVGVGLLAGSSGPGGIEFSNHQLSYDIGLLALAAILFSGGLDTRSSHFRMAIVPAGVLSTLGLCLMVLVTGILTYLFTPFTLLEGFLLGAILAPTDAAAVFSALRGRGLSEKVQAVLETESGTNDPLGIYLTLALTTLITTSQIELLPLVLGILFQLGVGGLLGYGFGKVLSWLINHIELGATGLYPVLAAAGGLLCYATTTTLGGNGFLAIYLSGIVLGNTPLAYKRSITGFMDELAWGAQITMFTLLGLLAFPNRWPPVFLNALFVSGIALLIARPLTVWFLMSGLGAIKARYLFNAREKILLSWAGLKGAVPIVLALVPLLNHVPNAETMFNVVFVVVVFGTALQGMTIGPLASRLGLVQVPTPKPPVSIELGGAAPPGSAISNIYLTAKSKAVGQTLTDLKLPSGVTITAIYRDELFVAPKDSTSLKSGDHVFIFSTQADTSIPTVFGDAT